MSSGEVPYFDEVTVLNFIERVAAQKSLVIYAGAGVSIDRTGLQWEQLIGRLMLNQVKNHQVRERLLANGPLQSASIVKQMYINQARDAKSASSQLGRDVRASLYTEQWRRAEIARAVMKLVAELRREGKAFHVITTNYDNCLEQELKTLNTERRKRGEPRLTLRSLMSNPRVPLNRIDQEVDRLIAEDRIVHIHGYVPEEGHRTNPITLSEVDYAKAYPLSSRLLERLFKDHSVLILGSSLTDPPLLSALANTTSTRGRNNRLRLAVMPIQGFGLPPEATAQLKNEIRDNVESRMRHFDVNVTFPDYFCEVAQFVTEVRICARRPRPAGRFRDSPKRHGGRLTDWWSAWAKERSKDWAKANLKDHDLLKKCVVALQPRLQRQVLDAEVEIWVRWKPDTDKTQFRLWASSRDAWPDVDARTAKINDRSAYLSVRTFSLGRVESYPPEDPPGRRRRRYLCVPIKSHEITQEELLTAVISFAYRLDNGGSDQDLVLLDKLMIVEELTTTGQKIVDPSATAQIRSS